jgi:hypothetical protein
VTQHVYHNAINRITDSVLKRRLSFLFVARCNVDLDLKLGLSASAARLSFQSVERGRRAPLPVSRISENGSTRTTRPDVSLISKRSRLGLRTSASASIHISVAA